VIGLTPENQTASGRRRGESTGIVFCRRHRLWLYRAGKRIGSTKAYGYGRRLSTGRRVAGRARRLPTISTQGQRCATPFRWDGAACAFFKYWRRLNNHRPPLPADRFRAMLISSPAILPTHRHRSKRCSVTDVKDHIALLAISSEIYCLFSGRLLIVIIKLIGFLRTAEIYP
jgi:hypothetical protein